MKPVPDTPQAGVALMAGAMLFAPFMDMFAKLLTETMSPGAIGLGRFLAQSLILLPFVLGFAIAYLLDPVADMLERWRLPRWAAAGVITLASVLAVIVALLLLAHNLVAVIVAPALALWTVVLLLTRGRAGWRPALLGAAGAIWGFGLAAFFTLPVLMEGDLVQLDSLAETLQQTELLYPSNFVTVRDLFLQRTTDYSFLLGAGDPERPPHHNARFVFDEECLPLGVEIFARAALDYLG